MKIATWNVNSIRQRLPRLLALLARHDLDAICLQETKVTNEDFPFDELLAAGYHSSASGQRAYNGVAVLTREPHELVSLGLPEGPVPDEARLLAIRTDDLAVVSLYAVNGKHVGDPAYQVKLRWFDAVHAWAARTFDPAGQLVLAGDFNVAPDDRDVHDPVLWKGSNLASEPERERIRALQTLGLADLGRASAGDVTGPFTWWDYRSGAFHKGWGLRLDLMLASQPVLDRLLSVEVDREERKPSTGAGKPSDHAPVIATLTE